MNKVWKKEVKKSATARRSPTAAAAATASSTSTSRRSATQGLYGYCAPERRKPGYQWLASGYCVLDNDFVGVPASPRWTARKVTAAHEFFHAIQFGYDFGEDVWMLEATATWMEERVFDEVNDNRQYLPAGQVVRPDDPARLLQLRRAASSTATGRSSSSSARTTATAWSRRSGTRRPRSRGAPDLYSTKAISAVLKPKGGFAKIYSRFASANLLPGKFYPEGADWPSAQLKGVYTLTKAQRRTGKHGASCCT